MEVHHHAHTPRKKWTHYFWEFLMLFLAVTLGFFVENQREHYIEHLREKQYAKLLYDDLTIDTTNLKRTHREKRYAIKKIDSLQKILDSSATKENNELIYYFERFLTKNDVFTSQNVTYKQLLNSGNFRYFNNIELYKKISDYYNLYERYLVLGESEFGDRESLEAIEAKLFDAADLNSLFNPRAENFYTLFNRPQRKFRAVKEDIENLNFLKIRAGHTHFSVQTSAKFIDWLNLHASAIIEELKKEYHFK